MGLVRCLIGAWVSLVAVASRLRPGPGPCAFSDTSPLPFCNASLTDTVRASDLVKRMTVDELVDQLETTAPAIPRLHIPQTQYWNEALHGLAKSPGVQFIGSTPTATVFPQVIALGATLDRELWKDMGRCIAGEARAFYRKGHAFLTFFNVNINVFRDPRWGRGQEVPSEDPFLNSEYAVQVVQGMQGGGKRSAALATCKHFEAYSFEAQGNLRRTEFNAVVQPDDMHDTYLPAFRACVRRANVSSVMCAYNFVNDRPACADPTMLDGVLRRRWGFGGYVVSDCSAIRHIFETAHAFPSPQETVAAALRAGTDMACRYQMRGTYYQQHLRKALQLGLVEREHLERAAQRIFAQRLRLGEFDEPPSTGSGSGVKPSPPQPPARWWWDHWPVEGTHAQRLALDAARKSIVLLYNRGRALPITRSRLHRAVGGGHARMLVAGPLADDHDAPLGNYHGFPRLQFTPLEGIRHALAESDVKTQLVHVPVCGSVPSRQSGSGGLEEHAPMLAVGQALQEAARASIVVAVVGLGGRREAETRDRTRLGLPTCQSALLRSLRNVTRTTGAPLIVVLVNGGPVTLLRSEVGDAVVEAWYGGQAAGLALAEVLFGTVSPSGRLPVTVYPSTFVDASPFADMDMRRSPGRTYRYFQGRPVFPFGHGLSYTTFDVAVRPTTTIVIDDVDAALACNSDDPIPEHSPNLGAGARSWSISALLRNTGARLASVSLMGCLEPRESHPLHSANAPLDPPQPFDPERVWVRNASRRATSHSSGEVRTNFLETSANQAPSPQRAMPRRFLFDFARAEEVRPGEVRTVQLTLRASSLCFADSMGRPTLAYGPYTLHVGSCGPPIEGAGTDQRSGAVHAAAGLEVQRAR